MLKIGDFSKLSRISIRMLRHYDEIHLLAPKNIDIHTGYRYYDENQLPLAARINALKDMGFNLFIISELLKQYNNPDFLKQQLLFKQMDLQEQKEKIEQQLFLIETTIKKIGKDENFMNYNVTLKTLPERYVASVRKIIPSYNHEKDLWEILIKETEMLHIKPSSPCYTTAIFHEEEYKETDVDVEIQKSVIGTYKNTQNVIFKTVPPIQIASATYKGDYEKVPDVNQAVANWIVTNGYEFDGLSFCIYHISPYETQNPDEWVTEVCYPIKNQKKNDFKKRPHFFQWGLLRISINIF